MRNAERIIGLDELLTRAAELTNQVAQLNARMHNFVRRPGIPATREHRAALMLDQMAELLAERELIRQRLVELDPALSASAN